MNTDKHGWSNFALTQNTKGAHQATGPNGCRVSCERILICVHLWFFPIILHKDDAR
jgi:hypothetical protein